MRRLWISLVLVAGFLLALGSPALAADIVVDAPTEVTVGDDVTVAATITDAGEPIVGGEAALAFVGRLGGESDWVVVATGTTGDDGVVTFEYPQRALDAERMRVQYFGPDGQENAEFTVGVNDGPQQVVSDAGADIPILGVWWLVVVLVIVWALVLIATGQLLRVGAASERSDKAARVIPRIMVGFVAFTAIGMLIVVITKPQSHANLEPTDPFDRVPRAVIGADLEYTGLGDPDGVLTADLSGEQLFVKAGCVNCHGPSGAGGLVGGAISGEDGVRSVDSLTEEVRDGPKGMPAYSEERLTDDQIATIFDYLQHTGEPS